jgi:DNA-binding SARP family transcriptional activator
VHCFGWHPRILEKVLSAAFKNGIESDYARLLAEKRLGLTLTSDGESIPLLDLITLAPPAFITDQGKRVDFVELTPTHRELLALLAAAPQYQMSQEYIQAVFWPESPPKKARSTFDSLLSRLRKVLDERLVISSARHYLVLEKGFLRLQNCRIDAHRFIESVQRGMAHLRRKEKWQAANAFYSAHSLYHGEYMPGVSLRDTAAPFHDHLMLQYLESTLKWIGILGDLGRTTESIQVAEEALRFDPTHEPLVKALYRLCIKSDQPVKAHKVIKTFQKALSRYGYSEQELETVMEAFWNSVPIN